MFYIKYCISKLYFSVFGLEAASSKRERLGIKLHSLGVITRNSTIISVTPTIFCSSKSSVGSSNLSESRKEEDDINSGESETREREADHEEDEEPFP